MEKPLEFADALNCSVYYLLGRTDVVSVADDDAPVQNEMYLTKDSRRLNEASRVFIYQTITTAFASGMYVRDPHNADLTGT